MRFGMFSSLLFIAIVKLLAHLQSSFNANLGLLHTYINFSPRICYIL